ncbi:Proton-dependent oligopeptide transporter family [Arabidopsis thaliana x Arabidopsis arenosa]|uniref:Proton-dependent oligopeptide transporter family n=1 Tax=Arabidopsis thaliana x Arabidopsis arenosa TaxID=1240361 RepID=A0A8T2AV01_9BRAS|nr:Proton-dependent oligopeptide transporter family [Arabidopsis thaliana x Arabidopsis arenosa]
MENPPDQTESKEILQQQPITRRRTKGGLLTMPFIIANEGFEKVASYGLLQNMILYLMSDYRLGLVKGQTVLFMWVAATNFMPLVGAFLSDSYLGRFLTIAIASLSSLLGMVVLWLTAMLPQVKPSPCVATAGTSCSSATSSQLALLYTAFALISIGSGGIRPCSLAFGADQLDNKENPKNERVLESFFGWYYASSSVAVLIAFTVIVYIQDHLGWKIGFGIPAILMLFAGFLFVFASPLYVKRNVSKSLFTGLAQVVAAAYVNRNLTLPDHHDSRDCYYRLKDSELKAPSEKLRFLNKACAISNREEDLGSDGLALNPWRLCTTDQVEELKALVKVIPVWSTGIMMSINVSQNSFQLLQAKSMDRHLSSDSSFQIPAGSFGMFTIIALISWVVLYDRAILPLASKIRGRPVRVNVKIRMGLGLFISFLAMAVSATVEHYRRKTAISQGLANDANSIVNISAMWLVPQYVLHGLAEALTGIGQTEFFYTEFPKSMSSIAASLFGLGMAVANILASVILNAVKNSSKKGNVSWIEDNINKGHYDYYYWILAILSFVNVIYYVVCSWSYGPTVDQVRNDKVNGMREEEEEVIKILN